MLKNPIIFFYTNDSQTWQRIKITRETFFFAFLISTVNLLDRISANGTRDFRKLLSRSWGLWEQRAIRYQKCHLQLPPPSFFFFFFHKHWFWQSARSYFLHILIWCTMLYISSNYILRRWVLHSREGSQLFWHLTLWILVLTNFFSYRWR